MEQMHWRSLPHWYKPGAAHFVTYRLANTLPVKVVQLLGETADKISPLSSIMHSLKSYTANEANKVLGRKGRFWQPESYDHWVRDEEESERIVDYIRGNPIAAGLVTRPEDWFWSSCHDRFLLDADTSGWLPLKT